MPPPDRLTAGIGSRRQQLRPAPLPLWFRPCRSRIRGKNSLSPSAGTSPAQPPRGGYAPFLGGPLMTWISVNPYRPHGPFSTPIPLHLWPPNGKCICTPPPWLLIDTCPLSICPAMDRARSVSPDHTDAVSPYWLRLARAISSDSSRNGMTGSTGPNCTSSTTGTPS